jgi:predicted RNase H-like HicB family nuclease
MNANFTAIVQQDDNWWVGWVKEVPGANAQEKSREELLTSLSEALKDILELNAKDAMDGVSGQFEEVALPA